MAQADGRAQVVIPVLQDRALAKGSRIGGIERGVVRQTPLGPRLTGSVVIERDGQWPFSCVGDFKDRREDVRAGRRKNGCLFARPKGLIADGINGCFHHDQGLRRSEVADGEPCRLFLTNGEEKGSRCRARSRQGG
jgi:hypothetical protein